MIEVTAKLLLNHGGTFITWSLSSHLSSEVSNVIYGSLDIAEGLGYNTYRGVLIGCHETKKSASAMRFR